MAKTKKPLFSFGATGGLGDVLSFARRMKLNIAERKPIPVDAQSPPQLAWRHMFLKCRDLWHALAAAEKQEWESAARPKHMTGYAWFISQCLRPNPGIYLPLQGGTMQGDIDMAKHRLLKLPIPTANQEAATKKYHDDNLPIGGYTEGARVYHSVSQSIPHNTVTALAFNSERYDTDTIHDPVTNNSRLTCKTAGKYLIIGSIQFNAHATGWRALGIKIKGVSFLTFASVGLRSDNVWICDTASVWDLAVNDYVELCTQQTSGAALGIPYYPHYTPQFMMQRIG